jgi:exodeoxyribonuclease III
MKIATWNVNSVKTRLAAITAWLKEAAPDVVALQEIKSTEETFPAEAFGDLGYNVAVFGQKSYNGVALLAKRPFEDVTKGLAREGEDEARYIEALVPGDEGMVRVASIYAPNGNGPDGIHFDPAKFAHKLDWMEKLRARAEELLTYEEPQVLMGDFNVIPKDEDCYDPAFWSKNALTQPQARAALQKIESLGFTEAFRVKHAEPEAYSFWDYRDGVWGGWKKNRGVRIDLALLSPQALDRLEDCAIDKAVRGEPKPSDHASLWCRLKA